MLRLIALLPKVVICFQRVLHRRRVWAFRRQPVCRSKHAHAFLVRKRCAEALCVVKVSAGVSTAVQIKYNALPALVLGYYPRAFKVCEGMIARDHVLPMYGLHQLAQLILPAPYSFQRTVSHQRLEEVQLRVNQFCRQTHSNLSFRCHKAFFMLNLYYTMVMRKNKNSYAARM